jgi:hypothetical protein
MSLWILNCPRGAETCPEIPEHQAHHTGQMFTAFCSWAWFSLMLLMLLWRICLLEMLTLRIAELEKAESWLLEGQRRLKLQLGQHRPKVNRGCTVRVCVCVCVCVCMKEREREGECEWMCTCDLRDLFPCSEQNVNSSDLYSSHGFPTLFAGLPSREFLGCSSVKHSRSQNPGLMNTECNEVYFP